MSNSLESLLNEIEARCEKATKGPWVASVSVHGANVGSRSLDKTLFIPSSVGKPVEDCQFIAHAREDVPRLLRIVRQLREQRNYMMAQITWEPAGREMRRLAEDAELLKAWEGK